MDYLLGFAAIAYGAYGLWAAGPEDSIVWPLIAIVGGALSVLFAIKKPHRLIAQKLIHGFKQK